MKGVYSLRGRDALMLRDEIARSLRRAAEEGVPDERTQDRIALQICRDRSDWLKCSKPCEGCRDQAINVMRAIRAKGE